MDWKNMSNSEIEVKIKELEFEFERTKLEIGKLYEKLNNLTKDYNNGKYLLEKRLNPTKLK